MFIQVIEGNTNDEDAFHAMIERWERDLKPGATGYLGSTAGCTSNGDCILVARFEDRDAAMRNSDRPEQDAWWQDMAKCFTAPPRFHESEEVHVMQHGDLDSARFVQVMDGHVSDRRRAIEMEDESDDAVASMRPDLLGVVSAYFDDDEFTSVAYFTTEEEARVGEKMEMPSEMAEKYAEFEQVMKVDRYLDVNHPHMTSG